MADIELSERKKKILSIIVDAYVETAEPVGSTTVVRKYAIKVSPATIRNEMSSLEEKGLITHPHTSAGRIPTDYGYRYFINHLLQLKEVSPRLAYEVSKEFKRKIENLEELIERTSRILATLTEQAGIVSYPELKDLSFRELDLHRLDAKRVLVIWVTSTGFIQDQVIDMEEEVPEDVLKQITNFFNQELAGFPFHAIPREIMEKLSKKRNSLYQLYQQALRIAEQGLRKIENAKLCLEGSSFILQKPEFQDINKTRLLFQALEQKEKLFGLMREDIFGTGVQVHIGRENKWPEIWDCSLITTSYKWRGKTVGVLGILGPSRMRYPAMISFVDYISKAMGEVLERWH